MKAFLLRLIPIILEWIVGYFKPVIKEDKDNRELKKRQDARIKQAQLVESLRQQYLKVKSSDTVAAADLKKRIRDETIKLNNM